MQQPGRVFNSSSYRYGFNGKENDPEIKTQDYGFRIYDYRLAKFLSVDPLTKEYPELTPYQFASNTPIKAVDLDGLETSWRPEGQLKPRENDNSSRSESTAQYATVNRELYATRSNEKPQPTIGPCDHCPKRIPTADDNKPNIRSPESDPVVQQIKKDNIEKVENSPTNIFPVISNLKKSGKYELMGMHKEAASSLKDAAIEAGVSYGVGKIFQFGYRYFTAAKTSTTTVYRNFGWNEYKALRANGNNFEIGSNFGSKQFWLDDAGINWWNSTSFSKNFTAKITVNNNALNQGYKFLDAGKYRAISFDSKEALNIFNKNMKIEWIQYK